MTHGADCCFMGHPALHVPGCRQGNGVVNVGSIWYNQKVMAVLKIPFYFQPWEMHNTFSLRVIEA